MKNTNMVDFESVSRIFERYLNAFVFWHILIFKFYDFFVFFECFMMIKMHMKDTHNQESRHAQGFKEKHGLAPWQARKPIDKLWWWWRHYLKWEGNISKQCDK